MAKDPLLPLKLLVYGMGIFLVGGFFWLSITISMKAGDLQEKSCEEITLPMPPEAEQRNTPPLTYFADDHWVVQHGNTLWRYTACGTLVQKVTISDQE